MSGPDKPKVIGEEWSDERVKSFLAIEPYQSSENADFHVLLKAYRSMRAGDFERFIGFFKESGRDINAPSKDGQTILAVISEHGRSGDYADIVKNAGGVV